MMKATAQTRKVKKLHANFVRIAFLLSMIRSLTHASSEPITSRMTLVVKLTMMVKRVRAAAIGWSCETEVLAYRCPRSMRVEAHNQRVGKTVSDGTGDITSVAKEVNGIVCAVAEARAAADPVAPAGRVGVSPLAET